MCSYNQESLKVVVRILTVFPHHVLANIGKVIIGNWIGTSGASFRRMIILRNFVLKWLEDGPLNRDFCKFLAIQFTEKYYHHAK